MQKANMTLNDSSPSLVFFEYNQKKLIIFAVRVILQLS